MIRYLKYEEIDFSKWDKCVESSSANMIYSYSWCLDLLADDWDGLVLGDYEAVMPLSYRKKYSFYYLYQAEMMQQGGVSSRVALNADIVQEFIDAIPNHFRFVEIMLNYTNNFPLPILTQRINLILDLNPSVEELRTAYSENTKRNIKKAKKENILLHYSFDLKNILSLFSENKANELKISDTWLKRVTAIAHALYHKSYGNTISAFNTKNQCVAGIFYVYYKKRVYFLLSGSNAEAKSTGAMHILLDALIEKFAGEQNILDFEGSNNDGLARFYKSFAATEQNYPFLKINNLPFYLKWMKK